MNDSKHENRVAVKPRPNPLGERSRAFSRSKKGVRYGNPLWVLSLWLWSKD